MKKSFLWSCCCLFLLVACNNNSNSLIGSWTVDKVNVQFDENRSTPELVKQIGEMERQNSFSISPDSILFFNGLDESFEGRISLTDGNLLYCGNMLFGEWKEGQIVTQTDSPLGEIVVMYRKN